MNKFFLNYNAGLFSLFSVLLRNWGKVKSQSAFNKYNDYKNSINNKNLLNFQIDLFDILKESHLNWESYDYGQGYYYQSLNELGITGLRNTNLRYQSMKLDQLVKGKKVLEIGSNSGFLSILLSKSASKVIGFELNPFLVKISKKATDYLKIKNLKFYHSSFEKLVLKEKFDCVVSFSNHTTYDNNTKQDLDTYLQHCFSFLEKSGLFLFESHPPIIEKGNMANTIKLIEKYFVIIKKEKLHYGNDLDFNRYFIVAKKK